MTARPTLLIADPDVRGRLRIVDILKADYQLDIPGPGEPPLRAARRVRPAVVLLAVPRGRSAEAVRTCRLIKTDSEPAPLIGLLDHWGRIPRPQRALEAAAADGYLGGRATPEDICRFTAALLRGEHPLFTNDPPPGIFRRLLDRARRP